jgi:hypothetical protein
MVMLKSARLEDNLVIGMKTFSNANKRRAFNKRVQQIKELGLIKVVEIKLTPSSKFYNYFMLSPEVFPPSNERATRLLWSGY